MTNLFVEKYFENKVWCWKYQYAFTDEAYLEQSLYDELYNWCLFNIGPKITWHIRNEGIIFLYEEDAMAFKLRWL